MGHSTLSSSFAGGRGGEESIPGPGDWRLSPAHAARDPRAAKIAECRLKVTGKVECPVFPFPLHSLKIVLQMDHLRCKTPHRVRNEFYIHLIGYNLIRRVMAVAAFASDAEPWTISFKGTLQTLNHLLLGTNVSTEDWCKTLLTAVATHIVGDRPDRYEPRLRKRRPKNYKLLREPRGNYQRRMAS